MVGISDSQLGKRICASCVFPSCTMYRQTPMDAPNVQAVEEELIIAVMGPTGVGKSSFINAASGSHLDVGHGLKSCTSSIQRSDVFTLAGRRIILIDTPGFDDTTVSDLDIFKSLSSFLSITYEQGYKLSGVIYLHRISDVKVGGKSRRNLNMFRKLCGEEALRNVIFVTTMWDHVTDPAVATTREAELANQEEFFKPMLDKGAKMHRYDNTVASARAIVSQLIRNTRDTVVLQVQQELVDQSIKISDTAAGKELLLERELLMKKHVAELQDVEREIRDADEKMAKLHHDESIEVRRELQVKIRQLRQECKQLEDEHAAHMDALRAKIHEAKSALDAEKVRHEDVQEKLLRLKKDWGKRRGAANELPTSGARVRDTFITLLRVVDIALSVYQFFN